MVKDNGRKIQLNASKAILATRSLYFDGMFHGGFQETASKSLPLPSDVQEKYFRQLLKFVYTGKTPIWNIDTSRPSLPSSSSDTFDNILQFLQVAHRYQVPHALRKIQLTIMTHFITRDTIGDILRIADEYELNDLREFCFLWLVIEWDAFLEDLCIDKLPDGTSCLLVFSFSASTKSLMMSDGVKLCVTVLIRCMVNLTKVSQNVYVTLFR
jgi:hypothetical protein